MRQKYIGVALLVLNLFLIPLYNAAGIVGHITGFIITAAIVALIFVDCRKNEKEYIKKMKENEE